MRLVRSDARPGPIATNSKRGERGPELAVEQALDHPDPVLRGPFHAGEHDCQGNPGADPQDHAKRHVGLGRPVGVEKLSGGARQRLAASLVSWSSYALVD